MENGDEDGGNVGALNTMVCDLRKESFFEGKNREGWCNMLCCMSFLSNVLRFASEMCWIGCECGYGLETGACRGVVGVRS